MRGGDGQRTPRFVAVLVRDVANARHFPKNLADLVEDDLPGRRDTRQALAVAREDVDTEFLFEQSDLFADSWLRGEKLRCGRRDVQIVVGDLPDVAKLLEFHRYRWPGVEMTVYRQME